MVVRGLSRAWCLLSIGLFSGMCFSDAVELVWNGIVCLLVGPCRPRKGWVHFGGDVGLFIRFRDGHVLKKEGYHIWKGWTRHEQ